MKQVKSITQAQDLSREQLQEIGDLEFYSNDLDKTVSIKSYLLTLLNTLLCEKEGFCGKRPFGNSGWEYELYACMISHDLVNGQIDEDGYIDSMDRLNKEIADRILIKLISSL
jgi:hypothetical protein